MWKEWGAHRDRILSEGIMFNPTSHLHIVYSSAPSLCTVVQSIVYSPVTLKFSVQETASKSTCVRWSENKVPVIKIFQITQTEIFCFLSHVTNEGIPYHSCKSCLHCHYRSDWLFLQYCRLQKPRDRHKIDVVSCFSLTSKKIFGNYWMFYRDKTIDILSVQWTTSAPCVLSETLLKIIPLKLFQLLKQRVIFPKKSMVLTLPLQWYWGAACHIF